jgi:hypothetical protein
MSMGTQCIGRLTAPQDRLYLSDQFLQFDPYRVKKKVPTYFNMAYPGFVRYSDQVVMWPNPEIIDYTTEEYSIDEQRLLQADRFRNLDRFCFLVRAATAEGAVSDDLFEMTIEPFDHAQYPDPEQIADVRRQLRERDGYPLAELLAEIDQKRQETIAVQTMPATAKQSNASRKPSTQNDKLPPGDPAHESQSADLPLPETRKRTPSPWNRRPPRSSVDGA